MIITLLDDVPPRVAGTAGDLCARPRHVLVLALLKQLQAVRSWREICCVRVNIIFVHRWREGIDSFAGLFRMNIHTILSNVQ